MRFQVPQFIDIEDKIFGPFTFKQFVYLAGGAGGAFALYKLLPPLIAIPLIIPVLGLGLALTFYKVNGKPFAVVLQSWFSYIFKSKLYIWKQRQPEKNKKKTTAAQSFGKESDVDTSLIPRLTESRLEDIAWSLDILDLDQKDK